MSQGTSHYAQREGNPTIYTISNWAGDWALAEPAKFTRTRSGRWWGAGGGWQGRWGGAWSCC